MIGLSSLKDWLRVSGTADDSVLAALEARAVAFLQSQTGRWFGGVVSHTEYFAGDDRDELWLKEEPSEVTVSHRAHVGDEWTELAAADADGFELRDCRVIRKRGIGWTRGYEWRVVYDFGYEENGGPEDIEQAILDLVALKYRQRGKEGVQNERIGNYSYAVSDLEAVPGLRDVIDTWKWSQIR